MWGLLRSTPSTLMFLFQQKLVADNFDSNSADADVHEIIKRILEHVEARVDILLSCLKADDFDRVMQKPPYGQ
jgi:hypothetical protein